MKNLTEIENEIRESEIYTNIIAGLVMVVIIIGLITIL